MPQNRGSPIGTQLDPRPILSETAQRHLAIDGNGPGSDPNPFQSVQLSRRTALTAKLQGPIIGRGAENGRVWPTRLGPENAGQLVSHIQEGRRGKNVSQDLLW